MSQLSAHPLDVFNLLSMVRSILTIVATFFCLLSWAQPGRELPTWTYQIPSSNAKSHFYYRVTMGEGATYDKAYANAFAKAILEASWKHGVRVNAKDDMAALETSITQSISIDDHTMQIPMNKVCDYWEQLYSPNRIRLYVLWQIADDALNDPKFEEYTNCQ